MIRIGQHRVSHFAAWWLTLLTAFVGSGSDAHADFEAELNRTALQNLDDPATLDAIAAQLAKYQLVGLGETTHGQAEMFDLRRRLTMLLVRDHGFRTVYYETGGAAATQLDRYIAGGDLTLDQAMQFGFDLLVWQNAENAALLEDLRAWNASADEVDRVRFVGVDFQVVQLTGTYLGYTLSDALDDAGQRTADLAASAQAAVHTADAVARAKVTEQVAAFRREVAEIHLDEPTRRQAERLLDDIDRYLATAASSATRDRGLAESLLEDFVPHANAGGRAVFWAHNAHVSAGPLRYLRSTEPAAGGVLREALGDDYYAVGFAFGEGSFAALDEADGGGWSFASYDVGPPGPGLLCEPLWASGHGSLMLDLRTLDARTPKLLRWADTPAGQRWWGGYRVDADEVAAGLPADRLVPTHLRRDFDGLIYLRTTRATSLREQPE